MRHLWNVEARRRSSRSDQLDRMIATLRHRGPDASGVHISGPAGLAHARLSIIDLKSGGQPMSTVDGRYLDHI